jgi:hypothetical protein
MPRGGKKRADAIQVGDRLWARDEFDPAGPLALKEVEEVFVRSAPLWNLHVAGQRLKTTAEHPFYVVGQGWVPAGMLRIGDRLLTQDGRAVPVEGVAPSGQRATVYNWRIAEYHTYYVSAAETSPSLWAHNADYNVGAGASEAPSSGTSPPAAGSTHPTFQPGPYAGESIPARSSEQVFTSQERAAIDRIGQTTGCHTCGTTNPGTRSGHFIPDHQPPSALNTNNAPQQLYPQCINCSREQGLAIARMRRGQQ